MGIKLKQESRYVNEINVTPMVDVMLVLLIIFMIGAPMLEQGVDIDLPKTKKTQSISMDTKPLIISMDESGKIFINENKIHSLESFLTKVNKDRQVLLRAHKKIDYGEVVKVMAIIKSEGFSKLGLVTKED